MGEEYRFYCPSEIAKLLAYHYTKERTIWKCNTLGLGVICRDLNPRRSAISLFAALPDIPESWKDEEIDVPDRLEWNTYTNLVKL